jgi:hypothetical protein
MPDDIDYIIMDDFNLIAKPDVVVMSMICSYLVKQLVN